MQKKTFTVIRDKYKSNRGGHTRFLNIYCENCGTHLALYQKDGPGHLKRMYLDRILAPASLTNLQEKTKINNIICSGCDRLIAVPTIYDREQRKSYHLLAYTTINKITKGVYPPGLVQLRINK